MLVMCQYDKSNKNITKRNNKEIMYLMYRTIAKNSKHIIVLKVIIKKDESISKNGRYLQTFS